MHRRRVLLLIAVLTSAAGTEAQARPAPPSRTAEQRGNVALLLKRMHAVAALHPLTPEAAIAALGGKFGPPKQLSNERITWKMLPSDLYAGGLIMKAGTTVVVTVAPAPSVGLVFEDVAASLMNRPYSMTPVQRPFKGTPRVWVVEHIFQVEAGQLRLQIFPTISPDDPAQVAKAEAEGTEVMMGKTARPAPVISFSVSSLTPTRDPSQMAPLAERRKRGRVPARTGP